MAGNQLAYPAMYYSWLSTQGVSESSAALASSHQGSFALMDFGVALTVLIALIQRYNSATVPPPMCLLDREWTHTDRRE